MFSFMTKVTRRKRNDRVVMWNAPFCVFCYFVETPKPTHFGRNGLVSLSIFKNIFCFVDTSNYNLFTNITCVDTSMGYTHEYILCYFILYHIMSYYLISYYVMILFYSMLYRIIVY